MDIDREEIRALCRSAPPGPWRVHSVKGYSFAQILTDHPDYQAEPHHNCLAETKSPELATTGAFICLARRALPALLDALEAAEARAAAAETALRDSR